MHFLGVTLMPKPVHHVFVCSQSRPEGHPRGSCGATGAGSVYEKFAEMLAARQLLGQIALTQTGCLGPCHVGPNVLVYPEGILYSSVLAEDVASIIDQHLIDGSPVTPKMAPAEIW